MDNNTEYEILRGKVDGKEKYCRIPIRSKVADVIYEEGISELSAEKILEMPHSTAINTIDAIIEDWCYWLGRANELFVLRRGQIEAQRWIPVSERLPEKGATYYLVTTKRSPRIEMAWYLSGDFYWNNSDSRMGEVIAWMPLPELYKEDAK